MTYDNLRVLRTTNMKICRTRHKISFFLFLILFLHLILAFVFAHDLAVIVNKANLADNVSFKDLIKIFKQEKQYWKNGKKIYLILQEAGSPEKEIALKKIYKMGNIQLKKFWLAKLFREEISSFPKTFGSNQAVKRFVSQVPNAIGYIDAALMDTSIKMLRINGKLPGEMKYILSNK